MAAFIGIDLGTTYSAISVIDSTGRPSVVRDSDNNNITPSCVAEESGAVTVGEDARRTWGLDETQAAARFKRDMGSEKEHQINGKSFTPTALSAAVLKKLVADAGEEHGSIAEAVVTVPANFSHKARSATIEAARLAGLNVEYIINEPTAAALYYAYSQGEGLNGTYAVYDLGGGTFDVSIIRIKGQDVEVLTSEGVSKLGGDDFDRAILKLVQKKYKDKTGEDLSQEDFSVLDAEDEVKKSLSKRQKATARVNKVNIEVTRDEFEEAISSLVAQAEMLCETAMESAKIKPSDVEAVFLAGGSTRIPLVAESVKRVFKQEPLVLANVDEVVALGASLYAAYMGKSKLSDAQRARVEKINLQEVANHFYGTVALQHHDERERREPRNTVLIKKGDKIPCSQTKSFFTVHDGQEAVNCVVTQSKAPETDLQFVEKVRDGHLDLPSGRPKGQEIQVTYSYEHGELMRCSFVDVATGKRREYDLNLATIGSKDSDSAEDFQVD